MLRPDSDTCRVVQWIPAFARVLAGQPHFSFGTCHVLTENRLWSVLLLLWGLESHRTILTETCFCCTTFWLTYTLQECRGDRLPAPLPGPSGPMGQLDAPVREGDESCRGVCRWGASAGMHFNHLLFRLLLVRTSSQDPRHGRMVSTLVFP